MGVAASLAAVVLWAYWPVFVEMYSKWQKDPQYSHGYLVPIFAGFLLWFRRSSMDVAAWRPSVWGLPILALGVLLKLAGAYAFFDWLEQISLLPLLAGAVLLLAGPAALRWSWPAIAFLAFMFPLPFRAETALSLPLQRIATHVTTYVLQTVGLPAFAEGNVIVLNETRIEVMEACNGLGMFILFFAMATAVAIVVQRPLIEKLLIVATAAPVAVAANVMRLTVTTLLYEFVSPKRGEQFHDYAGWTMMLFALGLLGLELLVLSRLFVDRRPAQRIGPLGMTGPAPR
jgi:exosortase